MNELDTTAIMLVAFALGNIFLTLAIHAQHAHLKDLSEKLDEISEAKGGGDG